MKRSIPSLQKLLSDQLKKRIAERETYRKKVFEKTGKPVKVYAERMK